MDNSSMKYYKYKYLKYQKSLKSLLIEFGIVGFLIFLIVSIFVAIEQVLGSIPAIVMIVMVVMIVFYFREKIGSFVKRFYYSKKFKKDIFKAIDAYLQSLGMVKEVNFINKLNEGVKQVVVPNMAIGYSSDYSVLEVRMGINGFNKPEDRSEILTSYIVSRTRRDYRLERYYIEDQQVEVYLYSKMDRIRIKNDDYASCIEDNKIKIMPRLSWDYISQPHGLITGITGSGKSYAIYYFIRVFESLGADISVIDPKSSEILMYAERKGFNNGSSIGRAIQILRETKEGMEKRASKMKETYRVGDYREFGYKPCVIFIDEMAGLMTIADKKEKEEINSYLKSLILLGRQIGYYVFIGLQRPDASIISGDIRDQLGLRLALGKMSADGYRMMFDKSLSIGSVSEEKGAGFLMLKSDLYQMLMPWLEIKIPDINKIGLNNENESL